MVDKACFGVLQLKFSLKVDLFLKISNFIQLSVI